MDLTCLDNAIGLSQTTCPCYDNPPAGYNTSDSGLFIDEVKGFNKDIANFQNCQDGEIWDILDESRTLAISTFYSDYIVGITEFPKEAKYKKCTGRFEDTKFNGVVTTSDVYVGIKLESCELRGTCLIARNIGFKSTTTGTIDLQVFSNADLTTPLFESLGVAVTANTITTIAVATEFPLWDDGCIELEYFVVVKLNGNIPAKNEIKCRPCSAGRKKCWEQFFDQKGVSGDVVTDAETWTETSNCANGIIITGEIACNYEELICPEGGLNYKDPYDRMIANAIQYKAAELVYCKVLSGTERNRFNTIDADELKETAQFYALQYEEFKDWVVAKIPENNNYCLSCNDNRIMKQVMFS